MSEFEMMSSAEKLVAVWLIEHGIEYDTQVKFGGGTREVGGSVVDFILSELEIVIRVMGTYWHSSFEAENRDRFGREQLASMGYHTIIDVWEHDLEENTDYVMRKAVEGQEIPR